MKIARIAGIAVIIFIVAVFTAPSWGGCGMNHKLCSLWCDIKHINSSFDQVACKGGCGADRIACMSQ
jgi:hypothetical protein